MGEKSVVLVLEEKMQIDYVGEREMSGRQKTGKLKKAFMMNKN